jgi:hypothetical protein
MQQSKKQKSIETAWGKRHWLFSLPAIGFFITIIVSVLIYVGVNLANRTYPTDCEIARMVYEGYVDNDGYPDPLGPFDEFLEIRFRTYGVILPGGILSDPTYSYALYYPKRNDGRRYKQYEYLISRKNELYSRASLSVSRDAWESGRKLICNDTNGEGK